MKKPRDPRQGRKGAILCDGRVVHPDLGDPVPTREECDYTPARPRGWRQPWIPRFVNERDDHVCLKCNCTGSLEVHHIKMVVDGGDDHPDNLATLCNLCHGEWTTCEPPPSLMTFDQWLEFPPMRVLLFAFSAAWPESMTARQYQKHLLASARVWGNGKAPR